MASAAAREGTQAAAGAAHQVGAAGAGGGSAATARARAKGHAAPAYAVRKDGAGPSHSPHGAAAARVAQSAPRRGASRLSLGAVGGALMSSGTPGPATPPASNPRMMLRSFFRKRLAAVKLQRRHSGEAGEARSAEGCSPKSPSRLSGAQKRKDSVPVSAPPATELKRRLRDRVTNPGLESREGDCAVQAAALRDEQVFAMDEL